MKQFEPMKPYKLSKEELSQIEYPCYAQPKFDGWRVVILEGKALTYKLKPIPNDYIRTTLESMFRGIDYYLIDGEGLLMNEQATYQDIQSAYSTKEGTPDFRYVMFDNLMYQHKDIPYEVRLHNFSSMKTKLGFPLFANKCGRLETVSFWQYLCDGPLALNSTIEYNLNGGYEGVIIRSPNAPYKFGRSTLKEKGLLAYKPYTDAEAFVIGATPLLKNLNDATKDEHGKTKRSSHLHNKIPTEAVGALKVRGLNGRFKDVEFEVGSGFTAAQRRLFWVSPIIGKVIKYKYQEVGSMDKPRQPIFLGFRSVEDL
jgi:DNA ligase-1